MSIASRLSRLENHRTNGPCPRHTFEVRDYPGENSAQDATADSREPETCALCGKPKVIIQVVYGVWDKAA
jgi:hypothetical protein